jgi:hypothetical protein
MMIFLWIRWQFRARREASCLPVTRKGGQGVTPQVLPVPEQHPICRQQLDRVEIWNERDDDRNASHDGRPRHRSSAGGIQPLLANVGGELADEHERAHRGRGRSFGPHERASTAITRMN